jgi:two-component system sensor histidine kinase KdpD
MDGMTSAAGRGDARSPSQAREAGRMPGWRYAAAVGICAAATGLAALVFPYLDLANIVMVFLLGVVIAALRLGRGPAIAAAVVSVVCFDVFFVPPYFSLAVDDAQYLVTLAVMLVVGVTVAELMTRLRREAKVAVSREERALDLFALARELSGALTAGQVVEKSVPILSATFRASVAVLPGDTEGALSEAAATEAGFDPVLARLALARGAAVGIGGADRPDVPALYVPLKAPMRIRGVLAIRPDEPKALLDAEPRRLAETVAALVGIALERIHYVEVSQRTLLGMESERLRSSLLGALSHDIRTPLTALVALADTLSIRIAADAPDAARQADALRVQAHRIGLLVENLLEMARLQDGAVRLNRDWQSVEELVGGAIDSLGVALEGRSIEIDLPPTLPLVRCDAVLIERVIANLLENAAKYTPPGSHIAVSGQVRGAEIAVAVADEGPGIAAGEEEAIFGKFQRGGRESAIPGMGLGLAIARAIVAAHGGHIFVENRRSADGRVLGASFSFTLPLESVPPVESEPDEAGTRSDPAPGSALASAT